MTEPVGPDVERIRAVESIARRLEVEAPQRADWLSSVGEFAESFLESLASLPAFGREKAPGDPVVELGIDESSASLTDLLATLQRQVLDLHLNPASPRFFGYIPGGGVYAASLGDYLAAVTNRYAGVFFASPGAARIENNLVQWIANLLGYPTTAGGTLTSGGSLANLAAVTTAREEIPIEKRGRAVTYMSTQVHHSMHKALRIAGMGGAVHREVPVDASFRMKPVALEALIERDRADGLIPWLLVSSAGTTNTGSIDPLDDLSDVAGRHGVWHHIDAAYGGLFVLWEEARRALSGIERGDSITVDPHKGLFLPYGCGCVVVRDRRKLSDTHSAFADYMQDTLGDAGETSPADYSAELTRHFRGLRMWLPLRLAGLEPFRAAIQEKALLARWFHESMSRLDEFECGPYPALSVATFRYKPRGVAADDAKALNDINLRLAERLRQDGRVFLSTTKLTDSETSEANVYLRLAVLCFRSHFEHVAEAIEVIRRVSREL